jgi:hypothetical protein
VQLVEGVLRIESFRHWSFGSTAIVSAAWLSKGGIQRKKAQPVERANERLVRTDVDRVSFIAIGDADPSILESLEQA